MGKWGDSVRLSDPLDGRRRWVVGVGLVAFYGFYFAVLVCGMVAIMQAAGL